MLHHVRADFNKVGTKQRYLRTVFQNHTGIVNYKDRNTCTWAETLRMLQKTMNQQSLVQQYVLSIYRLYRERKIDTDGQKDIHIRIHPCVHHNSRFEIARPLVLHVPLICHSQLSLGHGFGNVATELAQDLLLLLVRAVPQHLLQLAAAGAVVCFFHYLTPLPPDSAYVHVHSAKGHDEVTGASSRMPVGEVGGEDGGVTGGVLAAVVHEAWQSKEASQEG